MSLVVLEPGIESRIVDEGRPRTRSLGVPVGGAADRRSLMLGNSLLGNLPYTPALEIALKGPRLRAEYDIGCVLFGAPFEMHRAGYRVPVGHTFTLHAGEELRIGGTAYGMRAYLCVRGGFDTPSILGSHSGLHNVGPGETLPCRSSQILGRSCPEVQPLFPGETLVRIVPGLQASWFNEAEFHAQCFAVTPASNRMGVRLHGTALTMPEREMVSEPVCPGAVQVTRDGQCIVLGMDGQTIGGYPKIAQVIRADLDLLGQMRPRQSIRFQKITLTEANELDRQTVANLQQWTLRLRLSLDAFSPERRLPSA